MTERYSTLVCSLQSPHHVTGANFKFDPAVSVCVLGTHALLAGLSGETWTLEPDFRPRSPDQPASCAVLLTQFLRDRLETLHRDRRPPELLT